MTYVDIILTFVDICCHNDPLFSGSFFLSLPLHRFSELTSLRERVAYDTKTKFQTENLAALRELRIQEKAIKAQIDSISDPATKEAVAILAAKGLDRGEFTVPGVGIFQLQRTDVFDLSDHKKYKGEQAVSWRSKAKEKLHLQSLVKACTASMAGFLKTFLELNRLSASKTVHWTTFASIDELKAEK